MAQCHPGLMRPLPHRGGTPRRPEPAHHREGTRGHQSAHPRPLTHRAKRGGDGRHPTVPTRPEGIIHTPRTSVATTEGLRALSNSAAGASRTPELDPAPRRHVAGATRTPLSGAEPRPPGAGRKGRGPVLSGRGCKCGPTNRSSGLAALAAVLPPVEPFCKQDAGPSRTRPNRALLGRPLFALAAGATHLRCAARLRCGSAALVLAGPTDGSELHIVFSDSACRVSGATGCSSRSWVAGR